MLCHVSNSSILIFVPSVLLCTKKKKKKPPLNININESPFHLFLIKEIMNHQISHISTQKKKPAILSFFFLKKKEKKKHNKNHHWSQFTQLRITMPCGWG